MTRSKGSIGATDLMAELQNDPEYQRKMQAAEAERQIRAQQLSLAEQPIVADLREAAVKVDSVWDLGNTAKPYPAALPVLMEHMERGGYPDRVMESLGTLLAVKPSVVFWDRLKALYLAPRGAGEENGAAEALAACATAAQLDDLIGFLSLSERGQSRIYFIRPILKVGGKRGREIVQSLKSDPTFGKEARALLKS